MVCGRASGARGAVIPVHSITTILRALALRVQAEPWALSLRQDLAPCGVIMWLDLERFVVARGDMRSELWLCCFAHCDNPRGP